MKKKRDTSNEILFSCLRAIDDFEKSVEMDLDVRHLLYMLNTVALNTLELLGKWDENGKSKFARGTDTFIRLSLFIMKKVGSQDKEFIKSCKSIATSASTIVEKFDNNLIERFNTLVRGCLHNVLDISKSSQMVKSRHDDLFELVQNMKETIIEFREKINNNSPVDDIVVDLKTFLRHIKEVQYYKDEHEEVQTLLIESSRLGKLFVQAYSDSPTEDEIFLLKRFIQNTLECIERMK